MERLPVGVCVDEREVDMVTELLRDTDEELVGVAEIDIVQEPVRLSVLVTELDSVKVTLEVWELDTEIEREPVRVWDHEEDTDIVQEPLRDTELVPVLDAVWVMDDVPVRVIVTETLTDGVDVMEGVTLLVTVHEAVVEPEIEIERVPEGVWDGVTELDMVQEPLLVTVPEALLDTVLVMVAVPVLEIVSELVPVAETEILRVELGDEDGDEEVETVIVLLRVTELVGVLDAVMEGVRELEAVVEGVVETVLELVGVGVAERVRVVVADTDTVIDNVTASAPWIPSSAFPPGARREERSEAASKTTHT
jgi:hypothetical protein